MDATNLCADLSTIRDRELARGNQVESVTEEAFEHCDLIVALKQPFGAYYEDEIDETVVSADINTDPHYPVGKSYYCQRDRHALFAPQQMRR